MIHPGISNAELARRAFVAAPTMLRLLNTLSQAGLIARAAPSPEQRVRRTVLTNGGKKRLAAIIMSWLRTSAEQSSDHALPLDG